MTSSAKSRGRRTVGSIKARREPGPTCSCSARRRSWSGQRGNDCRSVGLVNRCLVEVCSFKRTSNAASIPFFDVDDMRRCAVRTFERAGVPRSVAMSIVGHKTESIYRRYAIVDEAMQREAAARLDAWMTAPPAAPSTATVTALRRGSRTPGPRHGVRSGHPTPAGRGFDAQCDVSREKRNLVRVPQRLVGVPRRRALHRYYAWRPVISAPE